MQDMASKSPTSSPSSSSSPSAYIPSCPFCTISQTYAPFSPSSLAQSATQSTKATSSILAEPETAYTLLSTPHVLAFLDHMPITRGHVLLTTRVHREKLSDVNIHEASVLGAWLQILSRAVMRALGQLADEDANSAAGENGKMDSNDVDTAEQSSVKDWNVVQNNGARAAQVVPHVHYHIIPRPGAVPELKNRSWTMFGRGQRGDLDEDEAYRVRDCIRKEIRKEVMRLPKADLISLGLYEEDREPVRTKL